MTQGDATFAKIRLVNQDQSMGYSKTIKCMVTHGDAIPVLPYTRARVSLDTEKRHHASPKLVTGCKTTGYTVTHRFIPSPYLPIKTSKAINSINGW